MVQKGQRKMRGNFRARELSSLDLQSSFFRFTYKKQDRNLRFTRRSDNPNNKERLCVRPVFVRYRFLRNRSTEFDETLYA